MASHFCVHFAEEVPPLVLELKAPIVEGKIDDAHMVSHQFYDACVDLLWVEDASPMTASPGIFISFLLFISYFDNYHCTNTVAKIVKDYIDNTLLPSCFEG